MILKQLLYVGADVSFIRNIKINVRANLCVCYKFCHSFNTSKFTCKFISSCKMCETSATFGTSGGRLLLPLQSQEGKGGGAGPLDNAPKIRGGNF